MISRGVALLGLGTVGQGVARLMAQAGPRIRRKLGIDLDLRSALVRDPERRREIPEGFGELVTDARRIWDDPAVGVVVEVMGGTGDALRYVLAALEAGKDVVTANKALLADHGSEIFAAARRTGKSVSFEASVGGGIPIVQAVQVGLAANQIQSISAILNGTCNFILTAMTRDGLPYETALGEAQRLGFAEPDPTLDVDGTDTAHKLAVLAQLAFGVNVRTADIPRAGIDGLNIADIRYAAELGYTVKLLALARASDAGLVLRVAPRLVRRGTPLAQIEGPYNAVRVVGDAVGDTLFCGRGAGAMPTASAILSDVIDVALGRAALTAAATPLWRDDAAPLRLASPSDVWSRNYLRFDIADRPGVLGGIAQVLGRHGISIASVIQHDPGEGAGSTPSYVPLVFMTHLAVEADVRAALAEIDRLEVAQRPCVWLGVEEGSEDPV